jgi:hypothetical protein
MAREVRLSTDTIGRIWRALGLQPHRTESFKLSPDPLFIDKVCDIAGLYLSPPTHAVELCVDEKAQIQRWSDPNRFCRCAWARSNAIRSTTRAMAPRRCSPRSTWPPERFLRRCLAQHRHQEYLRLLRDIDAHVSEVLDILVVVDKYATHKTPQVIRP